MSLRFVGEEQARASILTEGSETIYIDCPKLTNATHGIFTHGRSLEGLKDRRFDYQLHVNKYVHRALSKEDYPFRRKIFWKKPFSIGNINFTPIPVECSVKYPTTGLIIETSNKKLGYFPNVLNIFDRDILKGLDIYIGDGTALMRNLSKKSKGKRYGHAAIRTQLKWLEKHEVPRAIFMNLGKWARDISIVRQVFKLLGNEFNIKVAEAIDGYQISFNPVRLQRTFDSTNLFEILQLFNHPIVLQKEFVTLTGTLAEDGNTQGNIDIIQQNTDIETILHLKRLLPVNLAKRLSHVKDLGNCTSFVPLFDLVLIPSKWIPPKELESQLNVHNKFKYLLEKNNHERLAKTGSLVGAQKDV